MKKFNESLQINLLKCQKPARYISVETNSLEKEFEKAKVRVVLAFPDIYEIGMSNMGFNIMYQVINNHEDFSAERVFTPWFDFEAELKRAGGKLCSLETGRNVDRFDIIGFSIHYELSYTNILKILDLSGIPFYAKDRTDEFPLIIGGGSGVYNPEPIADFFDLFFIGDGEEGFIELLSKYHELKGNNAGKRIMLRELSKITGVYVPSHFDVEYFDDGRISGILNKENDLHVNVQKRIVKDLDESFKLDNPPVPLIDIVHDRLGIEISRGCLKGCRFCQAGMVYRPLRERSVSNIKEILNTGLKNTGYEDVSLLSLNVTEYSNLEEIISGFFQEHGDARVSLSLPSLNPEKFSSFIPEAIRKSKKTGLTLVLEAASERLRNVINKNISEQMVTESVLTAINSGWQHIKIYFMIGLPTEDDDDIKSLIEYARKLYTECHRTSNHFKSLRISISPFCPKPHTPFQWIPQESIDRLKEKMDFIKKSLKRFHGISISFNRPETSFMEGVFSRGDRRLSKVILDAYKMGCSFDPWTEHFKYKTWLEAFDRNNLDPEFYANRLRIIEEILPWDHIDIRVKKEFLLQEYEKSLKGEASPDCQTEICYLCGACDNSIKNDIKSKSTSLPKPKKAQINPNSGHQFFYRGRLTKLGRFRYISHLDYIRMVTRVFRRSKLPIVYTEGFSPKQKLSTGPALPLGMESNCEFIDFILTDDLPSEDIRQKLNEILPLEVQFTNIEKLSKKPSSISSSIESIEYMIRFPEDADIDIETFKSSITGILSGDRIIIEVTKKGETERIDIKPYIDQIDLIKDKPPICMKVVLKYVGGKVCRILDLSSHILEKSKIDLIDDIRIKREKIFLTPP